MDGVDLSALLPAPDDEEGAALIAALRQQQERQTDDRDAIRQTLGRQQRQAQGLRALSMLASVGQNPLLAGLRQTAGEQGAQMDNLAARTEARMEQARGGLSLLDVVRSRQAQQRLGQAAEALKARERQAAAGAARSAAQQAQKQQTELIDRETGLRKELTGNALLKDYEQSAAGYSALQAAAKIGNAQSDLAMVFGFMKTLDPTSVVKEGEQMQVRDTTNIPGRYLNMLTKAQSGQLLSPEQRAELVRVAGATIAAKKGKADSLKAQYSRIAQQTGVDPSRVVIDLDAPAPASSKSQGGPTAPAKASPTTPPAELVLPDGRRVRRNAAGKYVPVEG